MPVKWDLPPTLPPFWLDQSAEVTLAPPPMTKSEFVLKCYDEMRRAFPDMDPLLQSQVVANAVVETGWGEHRKGNNLGGWKITKKTAGPGVPWFRARGNKAPGATPEDFKGGDPPWCYYRVFPSFAAYITAWVKTFVPEDGTGRYARCGESFWLGEPWFDDLIEAGYKGENTKAHPWKSIQELNTIAETVATYWIQRELGVKADGVWGDKSRAAAVAYGEQRGVSLSGRLETPLLELLLGLRRQIR